MALPPSNGKTVLVTGINGYIGSTIGLLVLSKGYTLRGTTRRLNNVKSLLEGPFKPYADRLEIFEVLDMTAANAYKDAVAGVHGIFHVASPVAFELCTWEQVVEPAAQGTLSLLESAHSQAGGQLRSVVVTSSGTTVITPAEDAPPGYIFTENDQNTWAIPLAKSVPADFAKDKSGPLMYSASKVAAEQAMWQFKEDRRPSFAISSIHPSVVLGPSLNLPRNPQDLNVSLKPIYEIYSGTESAYPPPIGTASFVDMRDVAAVHLWALEHPEMADGERYIASSGFAPTQGMVDLMREQFPGNSHIALGEPGKGYVGGIDYCQQRVPVWYPKDRIQMCGIKAHKVMQIRWRTLGETVRDTVLAFQEFYGKEAGQSSIT